MDRILRGGNQELVIVAQPEYLLMRGVPSWEAAVAAVERPALRLSAGTVETATSELLAFRPTHSLVHDRE